MIVIDTNVFVAAGFSSRSAATRIVAAVREGQCQLVWNEPTRRETETILRRILGFEWATVAALFRPEGEYTDPVDLDAFVMIADRDDRKFAALAAATKTPLVTNDNHVLTQQRAVGIEILSRSALCGMDLWVQGQLTRPIPTGTPLGADDRQRWYADAAQHAVFSQSAPGGRSPIKSSLVIVFRS